MTIHIHAPPVSYGPWKPNAVSRLTDCCIRRVPPGAAIERVVYDESGWYEPYLSVRCPDDGGCNADRRLLRGASGRAAWTARL